MRSEKDWDKILKPSQATQSQKTQCYKCGGGTGQPYPCSCGTLDGSGIPAPAPMKQPEDGEYFYDILPSHTHKVSGDDLKPITANDIKQLEMEHSKAVAEALRQFKVQEPNRYLVSDAEGLRKALESGPQPGDIVKVNRQQPKQPKDESPEEVVHIVHQGSPLCKFTSLPPHEWPKGHYQIRFCEENRHVGVFHGCSDCFRAARLLTSK